MKFEATTFIQENEFGNGISNVVAILSRSRCATKQDCVYKQNVIEPFMGRVTSREDSM